MASRSARVTLGALAVVALGAAGYTIVRSEQTIAEHHTALRAFDLRARETLDALANARAGQQAYVAAGQGVALWTSKVATLVESAQGNLEILRQTAWSGDARSALMDGAASVTEMANVDKRARDYMHTGQPLMASDVVFTEGAETAAEAGQQIELARITEQNTFDQFEGRLREIEAVTIAGTGVLALLVVVMLAFAGQANAESGVALPLQTPPDLPLQVPTNPEEECAAVSEGEAAQIAEPSNSMLREAAELCTELGRVADIGGLRRFLAHAAGILDASGLIVWVGSATGADLKALFAHGYSRQTLARIPAVPRSADNAAAAAYRTGALQIVAARSPSSAGAIVVPLLSAEGCIGALAAEIKGGHESADATQSLALIFAAQLAGVVAGSVGEMPANPPAPRAAVASTRS